MTFILIILLIFVVIASVVLCVISAKPNDFAVHRVTTINALPEKIFPHINDIHLWAQWSPYEHLDPGMKRTHSGSALGQGAVYEWSGNSKAGQGRMEIVVSEPPTKVVFQLDFIRPFEGHNMVEFSLAPSGHFTQVTWAMTGKYNPISKVMCLFIDMDKMIGKDFVIGLANLKALVEKG